ncbi:hypothetical protein QUF72_07020 [Desulfobacterales bacterium HSG2]|nr:hypothetical protein [Desulfobacterales bacterium HSG2]
MGKGNTRDEALERLRNTLRDRPDRTQITFVDVDFPKSEGNRQNPWLATAGMFADDPVPMLREIYSLRDMPEVMNNDNNVLR